MYKTFEGMTNSYVGLDVEPVQLDSIELELAH
jgi:hypothetical protein